VTLDQLVLMLLEWRCKYGWRPGNQSCLR